MIRLSIPILVRADTPLGECIRLMRDNNTGAVLVVGDDKDGSLVGIFTERDLMNKIDLIQHGAHWERPIRTVMTTPVITLDASRIEEAPQIMVRQNIRQIPVVTTESETEVRIAGVVTMRDIFQSDHTPKPEDEVEEEESEEKEAEPKIFLMTRDTFFARLMTDAVASLLAMTIERADPMKSPKKNAELIILDIDGFEQDVWPDRIKELSRDESLKLIIISYAPRHHSPETAVTLEKLGKLKKFWIFKKPTEMVALITRIHKALS